MFEASTLRLTRGGGALPEGRVSFVGVVNRLGVTGHFYLGGWTVVGRHCYSLVPLVVDVCAVVYFVASQMTMSIIRITCGNIYKEQYGIYLP